VPFWQTVLERFGAAPRFVHLVRNPLEVAASLRARDHLSREHSLLLWLRHNLEAERATRGHARCFVGYHELLCDWRAVTRRISEGLQLEWPVPETVAAPEIESFLSSQLRHHAFSDLELDDQAASEWVQRAYLSAIAARERETLRVTESNDDVARELGAADALYGEIVRQNRRENGDLRTVLARQTEQLRESASTIAERDRRVARLEGELVSELAVAEEQRQECQRLKLALTERDGVIAVMHSSLSSALAGAEEQRQECQQLRLALTERDDAIAVMHSSLSWRMTAPLRRLRQSAWTERLRGVVRASLRSSKGTPLS
jgi:hypothetical protein